MVDSDVLPPHVMAARYESQLLLDRSGSTPVDVVDRLLAVQAQDARGSTLAIRARSHGLTSSDVDACLTDDRSLVVTWLNRGTLHLVRAEDYPWLHSLIAPRLLPTITSRLSRLGVSPDQAERAVGAVERALTVNGPLTRNQLRAALEAADAPSTGQAFADLLFLASVQGACIRGPVIEGERAFALPADWLGDQRVPNTEAALALLATRYLQGHGPATDRDLAYWTGLPLTSVRAGLKAAGAQLLDGSDDLLVLSQPRTTHDAVPPLTMLGMFDPLLHGWQSRRSVLQRHNSTTDVVTSNGIFRATVLDGGRAVATWTINSGNITVTALPGERLTDESDPKVQAELADIRRFLGL